MQEILIILSIQVLIAFAIGMTIIMYETKKSKATLLHSIEEYNKAKAIIAKYHDAHNSLSLSLATVDKKVEDINNRLTATQMRR